MDNNPLRHLTLPARVVVVAGILLVLGGTLAVYLWLADAPESQRSFAYYMLPLLAGGVLSTVGAATLWLGGVPMVVEEHRRPGALALPGLVLLFLSVFLAIAGTVGVLMLLQGEVPTRSYPLLFFALPVVVAAALFFALGTVVLKLFGVSIFNAYTPRFETPELDRDAQGVDHGEQGEARDTGIRSGVAGAGGGDGIQPGSGW